MQDSALRTEQTGGGGGNRTYTDGQTECDTGVTRSEQNPDESARPHGYNAEAQDKFTQPPALDATYPAFFSFFKDLVREQSVPNNIPFAKPWDEVEKKVTVPAYVKRIRGNLNVPRERFGITSEGHFLVAAVF